MEGLDEVTVSVLMAANISEGMMGTLSREDLQDLFPGPENFLRRKAVWRACQDVLEESGQDDSKSSSSSSINESPKQQTSTTVTVYTQLNKRLQNVRSPQKATPDGRHSKSSAKRRRLDQPSDVEEMDSSDSTIILDLSTEGRSSPESASKTRKRKAQNLLEEEPSTLPSVNINKPADINSPDTHCPATLAKHYKTLQTLFKRKNPNHQDVSQLLDLEFSARRAFIDSNTIREEDRHKKVLEAYPCFKDIGHVMEELHRILDKENANFINELKGRWQDFCQKVQFFGVWKKTLKPPMGMDKAEQALEILRVLPSLFHPPLLLQRGYGMRVRLWCMSLRTKKTLIPI
ncbi:unnamed protein product [Oreochromis niloticus]|nr:unnamed protein product [Mustela putorius furo]